LRVLVTGSAGFIGGYLVEELLGRGYEVVGLDNLSKYGPVGHSYDGDPRYRFVESDASDPKLLYDLLDGCDHFVAGASMVGGIAFYHTYCYDLLAANMRIATSSCDAAIRRHREGSLRKLTSLSSSMVYESASRWPSVEGDQGRVPPPRTAYGLGQLAIEYLTRSAHEQHGLPFTILRPFNCVGVGERRGLKDVEVRSGNLELALSHVVPDLVRKILAGQNPLHVMGSGQQVRCYISGGDLARGIATAVEHESALNEDFNLSSARPTSVAELARAIWEHIQQPDVPLRLVHDEPFKLDVARQVASTDKAKRLLGFEASTSLDEMLADVVAWIRSGYEAGIVQELNSKPRKPGTPEGTGTFVEKTPSTWRPAVETNS
jgi:nucleoside-diphosphate-sugar epimerase